MHHTAKIKRANISYMKKKLCENFPIYSSIGNRVHSIARSMPVSFIVHCSVREGVLCQHPTLSPEKESGDASLKQECIMTS